MQKYKVLLVGTILGSYRAQYIIDFLSQRNYEFSFFYMGKWMAVENHSLLSKLYSAFINKIIPVLYLLILPSATHVFLLPMNEKFEWVYNLAHFIGKKTIFDFYSSRYVKWVDQENLQIDQEPMEKKKVEKLKKHERRVIQHTDQLIFLNRGDAVFYLSHLGFSPGEIPYRIMPLATPSRPKAHLTGLKTQSRPINLCWWGKAAKVHGIDIILEATRLLQASPYRFHLYLMDIDQQRAQLLEEKIQSQGLSDVVRVRFDLSFATDLESFLVEHCDIALGSFGLNELAKVGISNKIVDALSMGIPMVTMNTDAIEEFGLDDGLLFLCEPDPVKICEAVIDLIKRDFDIDAYQALAMDTHRRVFSPERFHQNLATLFFSE